MTTVNEVQAPCDTNGTNVIVAPAKSDFFVDPKSGIAKANAPFHFEKVSGDFCAQVWVKPAFGEIYDAGGIFVFDSPSKWIKLEFEMTDLGYPSVVSVVTADTSDDANGEKLEDVERIKLQVARCGDLWALHYSLDGESWKMVRYFRLKMNDLLHVGIEAQSPVGQGCSVSFYDFSLNEAAPADMRKGR
jgi:hypothetical protein